MEINIPQRLKSIRETRRLTQEKVATGIGMKRGSYQAYEEGRATPKVPMLMKISAFYGINSLDQLLGIEGEIEKSLEQERAEVIKAYHSADPEKRRIVDFVLNLNC